MATTDTVGDTTSNGKRQRSAGGSPSKNSKKKKEKGIFICPICLENIVEATKTRQGQDSIFCEGSCSTWLHRKCAGLSRTAFIKIDKNLPYVCPHCKLQTQENEIKSLKNTVDMLIKTIDELKVKLEPLAVSKNTSLPADLINPGHSASTNLVAHNITPTEKISQVDRKSNIVVSGIKECPEGTSKLDRFKQDVDSVADLLHTVDPDFYKQSIRDSFRLGKFKPNATRPRSILVKFHRQLDAISILSNKTSLPNGIIIKPDMTREERKADSLLLQERWRLIQSGVPKSSIKISRFTIYVNKCQHGQVINSAFCLTPQSSTSNKSHIIKKSAPPNQDMSIADESTSSSRI